jgi:hypothetical protein
MSKLADDAHRPVLCISKNKTVNYHTQVSVGKNWSCQDEIGRWLRPGRWQKVLSHEKFSSVDCIEFYTRYAT